jgi:acetyltransferase-like isoleucine patch superfamily enzyme
MGNNVGINSQCYIAGQGGIVIGDDVDIGPQVKIFSENHNFSDKSIAIRTQGVKRIGVQIGKDCWIGSGVTILDGVEVGQGSVVAAGSVVTANVPVNCIVAGVPAKVIKTR